MNYAVYQQTDTTLVFYISASNYTNWVTYNAELAALHHQVLRVTIASDNVSVELSITIGFGVSYDVDLTDAINGFTDYPDYANCDDHTFEISPSVFDGSSSSIANGIYYYEMDEYSDATTIDATVTFSEVNYITIETYLADLSTKNANENMQGFDEDEGLNTTDTETNYLSYFYGKVKAFEEAIDQGNSESIRSSILYLETLMDANPIAED